MYSLTCLYDSVSEGSIWRVPFLNTQEDHPRFSGKGALPSLSLNSFKVMSGFRKDVTDWKCFHGPHFWGSTLQSCHKGAGLNVKMYLEIFNTMKIHFHLVIEKNQILDNFLIMMISPIIVNIYGILPIIVSWFMILVTPRSNPLLWWLTPLFPQFYGLGNSASERLTNFFKSHSL